MVVVLNLMQQQPPEAVMETTESAVPPGFRFHPTDEELVGYYLKKKVAMQKIDLDVIREIDLYRIEPWDIQERCRMGYEEQKEWYFFSHKDKKYPTGTRTNRATMAGFWKATGRDKAIYDKSNLIGMRKTLVFYKGRAPNGQKTDWIMHEYRLESEENGPPQEEGWVVCRAFKKRVTGQTKSIEGWDSSYLYDEQMDYIGRQSQNNFLPQNLPCKRDTEDDSLTSFTFSDQFVQLPQLESPSLPLMKRPCSSSASLISSEHNNGEDELVNGSKRVTDWRALDKFVASQLMSQEESFEVQNESDVALLMLQNSGEEVNKRLNLNGFLSTSSDCDIGICLLDK